MKPRSTVDFIGIGAPKCGTTWLFNALGQHPRICLSEPKEINYFNTEDFSLRVTVNGTGTGSINSNCEKPIDWYGRHFKHCHRDAIKGEFSPTYYCDQDAIRRIQRCYPNVKLIACLRNPTDCVYSIYWARRRYRKIEAMEEFETALESDRRYLNYGYFGRHLRRTLESFHPQQLEVVLLDDIISRPEETIRNVFRFLELETDVAVDLQRIPKNRAKKSSVISIEPWMKRFSAFLIRHDQGSLLHWLRNLGLRDAAIKISTVEAPYPQMRPETRKHLNLIFQEDLMDLECLLQRDLSAWT